MTVLLGVLAAIGFGVGDFVAGVGSRRDGDLSAPVGVAFVASIVGAGLGGVYLLGFSDDRMADGDLGWIAGSAVLMSAARPLLYQGMAKGPIVVFAPVFALVALVVPAVLGAVVGQGLAVLELIGVVVAVPAVALMSSEQRLPGLAELGNRVVLDAAVVGVLVGVASLFLSFVSEDAGAAPAFAIAIVGVAVVPVVGRAVGLSLRLTPTTIGTGAVVGLTSISSFFLAAVTFQRGNAAIGAALIGLSPGVTIGLAWVILKERLWTIQLLGACCGASTVLLFALA